MKCMCSKMWEVPGFHNSGHICSVSPKYKKKGGGGGRYNFSVISKQTRHSNDHIKGNHVRKGGWGAPWYPPLGETLHM